MIHGDRAVQVDIGREFIKVSHSGMSIAQKKRTGKNRPNLVGFINILLLVVSMGHSYS